jgi:signal transduction histidine kinase
VTAHQSNLTTVERIIYEGSFYPPPNNDIKDGHLENTDSPSALLTHHNHFTQGHIQRQSAVLAHEIKNALGSVKIVSSVIKSYVLSPLTSQPPLEDYQILFGHLERGIESINRVVSRMLELGRIGGEAQGPFNLSALVSQQVDDIAPLLKNSLPLLRFEGNPFLVGYQQECSTLLRNILINAVEASHGEGEVHIFVDSRASHEVIINVWDNGVGVAEGKEKAFFMPYVTTKLKGTGLGLAIAQEAVRHQGGEISLSTDIGTRVHIRLPRVPSVNEVEKTSLRND